MMPVTEAGQYGTTTPSAWSADFRGVHIESVAWGDPRAVTLRNAMEAEIRPRYADRHPASGPGVVRMPTGMQVDPADVIVALIGVTADGTPVGHAALRRLAGWFEVKRVFVDKGSRGTGISIRLMLALEAVARDQASTELVLQTGDRQPAGGRATV